MENPEVIPGVLLFFRRKNAGVYEYAFHLRKGGFNAGMYCVPGGQNEGLETYQECAIRESDEEIGIKLEEKDLKPIHLIYRKGNRRNGLDGFAIRPDMCFIIEDWEGKFENREPIQTRPATGPVPTDRSPQFKREVTPQQRGDSQLDQSYRARQQGENRARSFEGTVGPKGAAPPRGRWGGGGKPH